MPRTPIAQTVGRWKRLADSVTPDVRTGVVPLEMAHAKLVRFIEEVHQLVRERDFHEARKQEATRKIQKRLEDGRKSATLVEVLLKHELGHQNEELARFDIKPLRPRKRRRTAEATSDEEKSPAPEMPST
jgi:hypothetical protein